MQAAGYKAKRGLFRQWGGGGQKVLANRAKWAHGQFMHIDSVGVGLFAKEGGA
jgi:hypothetical protein